MKLQTYALAAVLTVTVPTILSAQSTGASGGGQTGQGGTTTTGGNGSGAGTGTGTATSGSGGSTSGSGASAGSTSGGSSWLSNGTSRWIASGFVGSNYSNNSSTINAGTNAGSAGTGSSTGSATTSNNDSNASADFGGSIGYLWNSVAGAEFVAGFTPNFQMQNTQLVSGAQSNLNTYMVNAVGAVPLGTDGRFQPFVSGGFGAVTLRSEPSSFVTGVSTNGNTTTASNGVTSTLNPDETRAGGNIGFGLMAFLGNWGVRGDVRFFHAFSSDNATGSNSTSTSTSTSTGTTAGATTTSDATNGTEMLPGLNFWRANIGLALRW
jgi:hypothetical protein